MLLVAAINGVGQTPNELSKFFYDLPIDTCQGYMVEVMNREKLVDSEPSDGNAYKINTNSIEHSNSIDSVILQLGCFEVLVRSNPNELSPMVNEQWVISSTYFTDSSSAEMTFNRLKSELDTFVKEPPLNKKSQVIEWVYSLETGIGNIQSKEIYLVYDSKAKKVRMAYKIIYPLNVCDCS